MNVDKINRYIHERIAANTSPVGYASGVILDRSLESVYAQFKTAMGKPSPSAAQSKASDQIDSKGFESMWEMYTARIACLRDSPSEIITPEKLKDKLDALVILGRGLLMALVVKRPQEEEIVPKKTIEDFRKIDVGKEYQFWYTEALAVIKRMLPSRLNEFIGLYKYPKKRYKLTSLNFRIVDGICGRYLPEKFQFGPAKYAVFNCLRVLGLSECFSLIKAQCEILEAANESFTSSFRIIQQVAQAELLDSELKVARRLNKNGSTRAAGAIAGVVLEKHLNAVTESHGLSMSKKSHSINAYARKLKFVIDVETCRFIQRLGKLRNLCHNKKSEPKEEIVEELINGVDKIIKTLV